MLQNARLNDTICKQSQLPYPNSYKGGAIMDNITRHDCQERVWMYSDLYQRALSYEELYSTGVCQSTGYLNSLLAYKWKLVQLKEEDSARAAQ